MGNRPHRLDMTMMYAVHDALRREAEHIARLSARAGDDPWRVLRTAAGWEMFKAYLRVHHTTEDDVLWPAMHEALTERPDGLALLEVMEAEHAAIDPCSGASTRRSPTATAGPSCSAGSPTRSPPCSTGTSSTRRTRRCR